MPSIQALIYFSLTTSKKKKKNPISLQSLSGKALWQFCLSQNGHISTLSQNVRPRGWVTLLDQPGTGGSNDLQAHSHYKECRRCPSTKGPDQEDCKTMLKEWSASVELTGATGHNWQTREAHGGQIDAYHKRWGGRLEGKRWEGRENYKGGGRRRRKRRKTTEAQIPFSARLSAFSFCIRHLLIQLVPTEHQGLKFLDVPNICNDDSSVNNTPLLDYELQFPREIFLFPLLWPDIQLRFNQPRSNGQGKG